MPAGTLTRPDQKIVNRYFVRKTEPRKVRLVNRFIKNADTILDFGCGNGLYAEALKAKCKKLIGLDVSSDLLSFCKTLNCYDQLIEDQCPPISLADKSVDVFFASEVIEHMPSLDIMNDVERVTKQTIIATIPNPRYSFYYDDPTHILPYTISSLTKDLKKRSESGDFEYKVIGLGFENIPGGPIVRRINQFFLRFFPSISPTVAFIGERKK